jgi:hypothetical protein
MVAAGALTGVPLPAPIVVAIDVNPGSPNNNINRNSKGLIHVAILGSDDFDALTVDQQTIFIATGAIAEAGGTNFSTATGIYAWCDERDTNQDGFADLVCEIRASDLSLLPGRDTIELIAETSEGTVIWGTDKIRVLP